jgi:CHAT domain-containing protein
MLKYAREAASIRKTIERPDTTMLLITMPTTPGLSNLAGVIREKEVVKRAMPTGVCCTDLQLPDTEMVLKQIGLSQILHLACHGSSDPLNPFESHLVLQKSTPVGPVVDHLSVSSMLAANVRGNAWIAYLSACATAGSTSESLADENIHLSSAFQSAGYIHVVGSFWEVSDEICVQVADVFYTSLMQNKDKFSERVVAEALHNSVLSVRKQFPQTPRLWATYAHFGA